MRHVGGFGGEPGQQRLLIRVAPVLVVAALLSLFVVAMAGHDILWQMAVAKDVRPTRAVAVFWAGYVPLWCGLTMLLVRRARWAPVQPVELERFGTAAAAVLIVAVIARVAVVLTTTPTLSDDIWRYIHDGDTLARGVNPYVTPPDAVMPLATPRPAVLARINHPELVTIYQPVSQYVFAALSAASRGWPRWDPLGDRTFRLGFVGFELLAIGVVLVQLRRGGRSAWWAGLYAWHPLAIAEVAGSGHQDPIGIALLAGALLAGQRMRRGAGAALAAGVLLALSAAVKPIVLPLALVLLWPVRRRPGVIAAFGGALAGAAALAYAPLALMPGGLWGMLETGSAFVDRWSFNASLHALAGAVLPGGRGAADWAMTVLLVVSIGGLTVMRGHRWRSASLYMLIVLLLSSTVHPWYLMWALALLPVAPLAGVWVLSLTIAGSYVAHLSPTGYAVPTWALWLEYVPVYAAVGFDAWVLWRGRPAAVTPLASPPEPVAPA